MKTMKGRNKTVSFYYINKYPLKSVQSLKREGGQLAEKLTERDRWRGKKQEKTARKEAKNKKKQKLARKLTKEGKTACEEEA